MSEETTTEKKYSGRSKITKKEAGLLVSGYGIVPPANDAGTFAAAVRKIRAIAGVDE